MKQTLAIVDALEAEVARLEKALVVDKSAGNALPGSQFVRVKALISDLKREIELNGPAP
jgi:hypothetical protein